MCVIMKPERTKRTKNVSFEQRTDPCTTNTHSKKGNQRTGKFVIIGVPAKREKAFKKNISEVQRYEQVNRAETRLTGG